jgi:hypothetical protein
MEPDGPSNTMPFTVSHIIAVVPLRRAEVPLLPLVIGSMAPDYFYFLPCHAGSYYSHKPLGVFLLTLPLAWLILWLFQQYLREPLLLLLPEHHQPLAAELVADPPAGSRWARPWATALLLLTGIITHLLWDSFTHPDGFMVERFEFLRTTMLPTPIGPLALNRVLQHGCPFAGLGGLALWYLWLFHRQKAAGSVPATDAAVQLPPCVRRRVRLALFAAGSITTAMRPVPGGLPRPSMTDASLSGLGLTAARICWRSAATADTDIPPPLACVGKRGGGMLFRSYCLGHG